MSSASAVVNPAPDSRIGSPVVGIDVGDQSCVLAIHRQGTVESQTVARAAVAGVLLDALKDDPPARIALELTGDLALPILAALETSRHTLLIIQHTDVKALRRWYGLKRKSDPNDAELIARIVEDEDSKLIGPVARRHLTPWWQMRSAILGRDPARHLQALIRDRQRLLLRARHHAEQPDRQARYQQMIELLTAHIEDAEKELLDTAGDAERLLATIPMVSLRRACILMASIGDISRFADVRNDQGKVIKRGEDRLSLYLGLKPPEPGQSGKRFGKPYFQRGLDLLHSELHLLAMSVARHPTTSGSLGRLYLRLAPCGKRRAMWAVKRHLIHVVWAMLRSGEPYRDTPARVRTEQIPLASD